MTLDEPELPAILSSLSSEGLTKLRNTYLERLTTSKGWLVSFLSTRIRLIETELSRRQHEHEPG